MNTVVIFGSRSIKELPDNAIASLDKIKQLGLEVLIGDAPGVDQLVIAYLESHGYEKVTVFYAYQLRCESSYPAYQIKGSYTARDKFMCSRARWGLAIWDGKSRGTRRNINQLGKKCKVLVVGMKHKYKALLK